MGVDDTRAAIGLGGGVGVDDTRAAIHLTRGVVGQCGVIRSVLLEHGHVTSVEHQAEDQRGEHHERGYDAGVQPGTDARGRRGGGGGSRLVGGRAARPVHDPGGGRDGQGGRDLNGHRPGRGGRNHRSGPEVGHDLRPDSRGGRGGETVGLEQGLNLRQGHAGHEAGESVVDGGGREACHRENGDDGCVIHGNLR